MSAPLYLMQLSVISRTAAVSASTVVSLRSSISDLMVRMSMGELMREE